MGNISYTAHVSNKKSAITSKSKLATVAKHNLRKYKSSDYSKDNICIIYGTSNLIDDVKTVYHKEFDEALEEYNKKQIRPDRKIEDYFEHVAGKEQDMAVEIIIQIGDREFWKQFDDMKSYMKLSYQIILDELRKRLPQFVVANAVVHLDEDSPHMHIVGVPVADGYKKGLSKQVSKRKVFTKELLSRVLQDELREVANKEVNDWFGEQIKEKSKGRNHDLTVAEYKVAQETEHLEQIQEQVNDADIKLFASQIAYKELERSQTKELNETNIATCIMVLKKSKIDNKTLFIDASKESIKATNSNRLDSKNIENILNVYKNRKTEAHLATLVKQEDIEKEDYNLSVSTYVQTEDISEVIDISALNVEISKIVEQENALRIEIDEIIAEIEEA